MKINFLLPLTCLLIFASCREETEKPKVIYDSPRQKPASAAKIDTAKVAIADLPIQITGTDFLIHPVGDLRISSPSSSKYASGTNEDISYTISNYNEFEITGFLRNLKFQKIGSDSLTVLTQKPVLIQSASYLKSSAKLKHQLLVYSLADMDTNKDGRLDESDIKSLYISSVAGENFMKLSADFQELIDWKMVESTNRLYFRTIEDTNKNGEFDKNDALHYSFVDLSDPDFKVTSYNPI